MKSKKPGADVARLTGFAGVSAVYEVDQAPIGRTPRSTPSTYVGFFDGIRALTFVEGIDGMLAAYVMLQPKEGWHLLQDILKDSKQEFLMRYACLRTLSRGDALLRAADVDEGVRRELLKEGRAL